MKIREFLKNIRNKAAMLTLFFIMFVPFVAAQAQTVVNPPPVIVPPPSGEWDGQPYVAPTLPAYCTPLPEDIVQLQECNDLIAQSQIQNYDDTGDLINGVGNGRYGMASAYNPSNNTLLFVSTRSNGSAILGQIYNSQTMEPVGGQLTIDQSNLFTGSPRVVYNNVTNNFFVTWQDERPASNRSSIYGRYVNPDGSMPADDFPIYALGKSFIGDLNIDYPNSRYVQGFDLDPDGLRMVTISFAGVVGPVLILDQNPGNYEGQSSVTYNSTLNEYWYVYATVVSGGDTAQEDDRIMFVRVDAVTMQQVGQPVQVSQTRLGRSAISSPQIAYSPEDGAAVVAWQERGRTPGMDSEVYGRTIYNNLSMGAEYPILTASTYPVSNFYGAPSNLQYNPATGTFATAVEDNNGGTTYVEFFSDGTIVEIREAIAPEGQGNYNPCLGLTGVGYLICASIDYATPRLTTFTSTYRGNSSPPRIIPGPRIPDTFDTSNFAQALTQIYLYALAVAGILAVAVAIFGGYMVMSARGNAAAASKGREYITSALIGLALLMAAFLILNTLNSDLTDFEVPSLNLFN
jgi:hypothetical protein